MFKRISRLLDFRTLFSISRLIHPLMTKHRLLQSPKEDITISLPHSPDVGVIWIHPVSGACQESSSTRSRIGTQWLLTSIYPLGSFKTDFFETLQLELFSSQSIASTLTANLTRRNVIFTVTIMFMSSKNQWKISGSCSTAKLESPRAKSESLATRACATFNFVPINASIYDYIFFDLVGGNL